MYDRHYLEYDVAELWTVRNADFGHELKEGERKEEATENILIILLGLFIQLSISCICNGLYSLN